MAFDFDAISDEWELLKDLPGVVDEPTTEDIETVRAAVEAGTPIDGETFGPIVGRYSGAGLLRLMHVSTQGPEVVRWATEEYPPDSLRSVQAAARAIRYMRCEEEIARNPDADTVYQVHGTYYPEFPH